MTHQPKWGLSEHQSAIPAARIAGDDDDFGDMPLSPSTDEDEEPLVGLPDEDAFAADTSTPKDPAQKPKAKKQKKRKPEAPATAGDINVLMVGTLAHVVVPSLSRPHMLGQPTRFDSRFTLQYPCRAPRAALPSLQHVLQRLCHIRVLYVSAIDGDVIINAKSAGKCRAKP